MKGKVQGRTRKGGPRKALQFSPVKSLLEEARQHYQRVDLHQHFNGDIDRVTKAQVALDTAEDAMLALSNFKDGTIGSDDGEKYLKLYGFLQAVFLQQDAIKELHRLFVGVFAEPGDKSAWRQVRELRNLTVGHPIEKGLGKKSRKRTFITRVSLRRGSFDYQVWDQATGQTSFESADLSKRYAAYRKEAASYMRKILRVLSGMPDMKV
jgi:hypothetical protein